MKTPYKENVVSLACILEASGNRIVVLHEKALHFLSLCFVLFDTKCEKLNLEEGTCSN